MFIDSDLKKIIELLPKKSVLVVNKMELMKSGFRVLTDMKDVGALRALRENLDRDIQIAGVQITADLPQGSIQDLSSNTLEVSVGSRLLEIYFHQVLRANTVHLDLRPRYFKLLEDGVLEWNPSALWYTFDADFLVGVRELYAGFYGDDRARFDGGLQKIGLVPNHLTSAQKACVADVFYEHFGEGQSEPIKFSLEKLRHSFDKIFETLLELGIKINPQFAFLGATLTTLYTSLEKVGGSVDVRAAYERVIKTPTPHRSAMVPDSG